MGYLFTSESVSEGHPDKICDQISDAMLDEALRQDSESRVAVEVFTTTGLVLVGGEVRTSGWLDVQDIARSVLRDIGYTESNYGIAADDCNVLNAIHGQSPDIAIGVDKGSGLDVALGAGDQGIMFGHACKQTDSYMPAPIYYSHQLMQRCSELRKTGQLSYLRPDAKAQVTVEYEGRSPQRVHTVVLSTQHDPDVSREQIEEDVRLHVLPYVIPETMLQDSYVLHVNPTGRFVVGGPHGDSGLTGRKIVVDTYGGWVSHGGGAFSGKDPTKVDRSAAYMARYVAKNMVAAGVCDELLVQLAYAIGVSKPISIYVDAFNTTKYSHDDLIKIINEVFDLTPEGIINVLNLKEPIYRSVAAYGHFGRNDLDLSWERLDKVDAIKASMHQVRAV